MSCRFIFVRHGESEGNKKGLFLGTTDLPLTALGERQAELTAEYLSNTEIDGIYSSPLSRAYRTAELIADKKDLSIITDSAFSEVYAGLWEGMSFDDITEKYGDGLKNWRENMGRSSCPEGESFTEVSKRVIGEILRISRMYDGQTVCIVTHSTPMRAIWVKANGIAAEDAKNPKSPPNASISIADVSGENFNLICYGNAAHLGDLITELPKTV